VGTRALGPGEVQGSVGREGALHPGTRAWAALRDGLCFAGRTGEAVMGSVLHFVCRVCPKGVCCWDSSVVPAGPCVKVNILHVRRIGKEAAL